MDLCRSIQSMISIVFSYIIYFQMHFLHAFCNAFIQRRVSPAYTCLSRSHVLYNNQSTIHGFETPLYYERNVLPPGESIPAHHSRRHSTGRCRYLSVEATNTNM